jgi:hypothetical protein
MDIISLEKRLEIWKRILFITAGASLVLFIQALLYYIDTERLLYPMSWYGVWVLVQIASFLPGFVLLLGKHWVKLPLDERLNTIFGYFAITWLTFVPVAIRVDRYTSKASNFILLGCAIAIIMSYMWLRRKSQATQNEIFP